MHLSGTASEICNDIYAFIDRPVKNIVPVRPGFTEGVWFEWLAVEGATDAT
jgi:hypothetical protein